MKHVGSQVPAPGIEPAPPAWEGGALTTGLPWKSPSCFFLPGVLPQASPKWKQRDKDNRIDNSDYLGVKNQMGKGAWTSLAR